MKLKNLILLALLVISLSAFTYQSYLVKNSISVTEESISPKKWTDIETAVNLAKADQKLILVDVYTDWCKWCKVMDKQTFADPKVASFLSENFHLAKFNAEQKGAIQFNGRKYNFTKNGHRGYHELAVDMLNGQLAYPSLVVYDSELNKLEVIKGFKNAEQLMLILSNMVES